MRAQGGHDPFDLAFEADDDFGPARDDGWRSAEERPGRQDAVDPFADLAPAAPRARPAPDPFEDDYEAPRAAAAAAPPPEAGNTRGHHEEEGRCGDKGPRTHALLASLGKEAQARPLPNDQHTLCRHQRKANCAADHHTPRSLRRRCAAQQNHSCRYKSEKRKPEPVAPTQRPDQSRSACCEGVGKPAKGPKPALNHVPRQQRIPKNPDQKPKQCRALHIVIPKKIRPAANMAAAGLKDYSSKLPPLDFTSSCQRVSRRSRVADVP